MTTIRTITIPTAVAAADLVEEVMYSGFRCCQICGLAAADLYWCIDGRDGEEIQACEPCYDTADVLPLPDCD